MRAVALGVLVALSAVSAARAETFKVVYYTSYKCPEPADKTAPGATAEYPLAIEDFDVPIDDEVELTSQANEQKKERATSRFECKWLRLSGFFTSTNYYHYRGDLVRNAWTHYGRGSGTPRYMVENFNDQAMRRSLIGHRKVTVVGQFYYLCLTAPWGDDIMFLFGPCHYGGVSGMMLANVRIEKVEDAAPRYLLGDANRGIIGDIEGVQGEERTVMIEGVRSWARLMQRGPEAYAREVVDRNPSWEKETASERAKAHARVASPDSYASYLNSLAAFRDLNVKRAPVEVFHDVLSDRSHGFGCVCLQNDCTNEWPLTSRDALWFYGRAACVALDKRDSAWIWD